MNTSLVRFKASDGLELQGWLSDLESEAAVIHIHGRSGNGYENRFLDSVRQMYVDNNVSFFAINTRGSGVIADVYRNGKSELAGSCYELFEESVHDISGAVGYLKDLGKTKFILQGHSFGGAKVVNYVLSVDGIVIDRVILIAPTDMVGWSQTDPRSDEYLAKGRELIEGGTPLELVGTQCWLEKVPISAQAYVTSCEPGSAVDIYGTIQGESLLGRVSLPMLIVYGSADAGIKEIDKSMDGWLARVDPILNEATQVQVIEGAEHGFKGYETELSKVVEKFIGEF